MRHCLYPRILPEITRLFRACYVYHRPFGVYEPLLAWLSTVRTRDSNTLGNFIALLLIDDMAHGNEAFTISRGSCETDS